MNIVRNKLFVFGGLIQKLVPCPDVFQVLDLENLSWCKPRCKGDPIPSPRESASSVTLVGGILVYYGGSDGTQRLNDLHVFRSSDLSWRAVSVPGLGPGRSMHTAIACGSKMLVFGGWVTNSSPAPIVPCVCTNELLYIDCGLQLHFPPLANCSLFPRYMLDSFKVLPIPSTVEIPSPRAGHAATVVCYLLTNLWGKKAGKFEKSNSLG